jgi:hypothetical protein
MYEMMLKDNKSLHSKKPLANRQSPASGFEMMQLRKTKLIASCVSQSLTSFCERA